MYRLCFALLMFANLAGAATIVNASVTCDGVTTSVLRRDSAGGEAMASIEVSATRLGRPEAYPT